MTVARSRGSLLTSKAVDVIYSTDWDVYTITGTGWTQDDAYTLSATFTPSYPSNTSTFIPYYYIGCNVGSMNPTDYPIQACLEIKYGSSVRYNSGWQDPASDKIRNVKMQMAANVRVYCKIYVRYLDTTETISSAGVTDHTFNVYTQTKGEYGESASTTTVTYLPPSWLETTTQTYQTATTVTRPSAYDDLVGTVPALTPDVGGTPPAWFEQFNPMEQDWFIDIISGLADWFNVVNTIANQIPIFWVFGGFVITGLLLAWLLH